MFGMGRVWASDSQVEQMTDVRTGSVAVVGMGKLDWRRWTLNILRLVLARLHAATAGRKVEDENRLTSQPAHAGTDACLVEPNGRRRLTIVSGRGIAGYTTSRLRLEHADCLVTHCRSPPQQDNAVVESNGVSGVKHPPESLSCNRSWPWLSKNPLISLFCP